VQPGWHGEQVPCGFGGVGAVGGVGATAVCHDPGRGRVLEGSPCFSSCDAASCLYDTKSADKGAGSRSPYGTATGL
jgi:hypothetical protein